MIRFCFLGFLAAGMLCAQAPNITQGPFVANISHSSATFTWTTDIASMTYSIISDMGDNNMVESLSNDFNPYYIHTWFVSGKPANTTIHYQVCSYANSLKTCSSTATFQTLAASGVADPIPPTPVDTPIVPTGSVHTVGATSGSCDDPADGLIAQWTNAPRGDIVEIPAGMICAGSYSFPARASGPPYILTRVVNAATTFPSRRSSPADKPNMARFVKNATDIINFGALDPSPYSCFHGQYAYHSGVGFGLYRCENIALPAITGITSSGNLRITSPGHGLTNQDLGATVSGVMGFITGASGAGAAMFNDQGLVLHVVDGQTLELSPFVGTALQANGAATGGIVYANFWTPLPHTNFSGNPPAVCSWGQWFYKTDAVDEQHGIYYCNNTNEVIQYAIDFAGGGVYTNPIIDLSTNAPNYLMFQGFSFEPLNIKGDGQIAQYAVRPSSLRTGNNFENFVMQSSAVNHIYWDNILALCPDPTPSGFMGRCFNFSAGMNGSHWHVGNSYFAGWQQYQALNGLANSNEGNSYVFSIIDAGPHEFINNYFGCAGNCVVWYDDAATFGKASDLTFKGNIVETPDKYFAASPSWMGNSMYFTRRQNFEFKRMQRADIEGNQFIGGWVSMNQGSAVCLCTRGGVHGAQIETVNGGTITIYPESAVSQESAFTNLHAGDKVIFYSLGVGYGCSDPTINQQIYTVASVPTPTSVVLTQSLGCSGVAGQSGFIVRIMADANYIGDILLKNNTIANSPTGIFFLGHDSYGGPNGGFGMPSTAMQRIRIENNLFVGIDNARRYPANVGQLGAGAVITGHLGPEDFKVLHNTSVSQVAGGAFFSNTSYEYGLFEDGSGLRLLDNVFDHLQEPVGGIWNGASGTVAPSYGDQALVNGFSGATPEYTANSNVVMRSGGNSGLNAPYLYTAGTSFFDGTSATFPFFDSTNSNYRVKLSSAFVSGGANHASDGFDQGADINSLEAAQGKVSNVRPHDVQSTSAVIGFLAPDSNGCTVDWSTNSWATYQRVANPGGNRVQNVTLSGLPAHSPIAYRVNCAAMQPGGTFQTF